MSDYSLERIREVSKPPAVYAKRKLTAIAPHVSNISLKRRILHKDSYTQALAEIVDTPKWRKFRGLLAEYNERTDDFFFVQIGANDGMRGDPVREHVMKYDWSGLLVEPVPHVFKALQQNYHGKMGLKFANVAVSDHDGTATMTAAVELPGGGHNPLSPMSSLNSAVVQKHEWMVPNPQDLLSSTTVSTMTLPTLLETFGVGKIDGLFIDTEGHDKVVLDQLDLDSQRPQFILYEHSHLAAADQQELTARFETAGYDIATMRRDTFASLV